MGPFCVVCGKPLRCGVFTDCDFIDCLTCQHNVTEQKHTICKCSYRDYEIHISRLNDEILELEHRVSCDTSKINLYQQRWNLHMSALHQSDKIIRK